MSNNVKKLSLFQTDLQAEKLIGKTKTVKPAIKRILEYPQLKRCLMINISDISEKLLRGNALRRKFSVYTLNTENINDDLGAFIKHNDIKVIVFESSDLKHFPKNVANSIIEARLFGLEVYDVHEFYEIIDKRIPLVRFQSDNFLADSVFSIGMHKSSNEQFKRIVDFFAAILFLPVALLLIFIAGLAIFLVDRVNPIFTQERVGKNNKTFKIFKLKTMVKDHNGDFTCEDDMRVTKLGKFFRRTKIDELPQIFNIILGDMSFIGSRPERPEYVELANKENAYFDLRHLRKPGITGWAQVNLPKATPEDNLKKLEYDLYYIKNSSILLDCLILYKTMKIILSFDSN